MVSVVNCGSSGPGSSPDLPWVFTLSLQGY